MINDDIDNCYYHSFNLEKAIGSYTKSQKRRAPVTEPAWANVLIEETLL